MMKLPAQQSDQEFIHDCNITCGPGQVSKTFCATLSLNVEERVINQLSRLHIVKKAVG